jgi:hypothetical protein
VLLMSAAGVSGMSSIVRVTPLVDTGGQQGEQLRPAVVEVRRAAPDPTNRWCGPGDRGTFRA